MDLDDKSWTKIPVLHMAGRVMPEEGKRISPSFLINQVYTFIEMSSFE